MRKTLSILLAMAIMVFGYKILPAKSAEGDCDCKLDFQINTSYGSNEFCGQSINISNVDTYDDIAKKIFEKCETDYIPDSTGADIVAGESFTSAQGCTDNQRSESGSFSYTLNCTFPGEVQATPEATGPAPGKSVSDLLSSAQTLNKAGLKTPADLVGRFINILLAFIGSVSLVLYIYAGILWMTASGASERVDTAKKILVWTTLGVVVMLASYILASFVFKSLGL